MCADDCTPKRVHFAIDRGGTFTDVYANQIFNGHRTSSRLRRPIMLSVHKNRQFLMATGRPRQHWPEVRSEMDKNACAWRRTEGAFKQCQVIMVTAQSVYLNF